MSLITEQAAADVAQLIDEYGNTLTLPDDSTVRCIVSQEQNDIDRYVKKTVTPENIADLQGILALLFVKPGDIDRLPLGTPFQWEGETYYCQPPKKQVFDDTRVLCTIICSTGGYWLMTDTVAVIRTTNITYDTHNRPVQGPPIVIKAALKSKIGFTDNIDSAGIVAAFKQNNLDTADYWWTNSHDIWDSSTAGYTVRNGDWLIDLRTRKRSDGTVVPAPGWGSISIILGSPFERLSPTTSDSDITQFRIAAADQAPSTLVAMVDAARQNNFQFVEN